VIFFSISLVHRLIEVTSSTGIQVPYSFSIVLTFLKHAFLAVYNCRFMRKLYHLAIVIFHLYPHICAMIYLKV